MLLAEVRVHENGSSDRNKSHKGGKWGLIKSGFLGLDCPGEEINGMTRYTRFNIYEKNIYANNLAYQLIALLKS